MLHHCVTFPGVPEKFKLYLDEGSKKWDCIGTAAEKHGIRKLIHHLPGDKGWSKEKMSISTPDWRNSNLCPHREENRELLLKIQFLTGIKNWHNLEILEAGDHFFIDLLDVGTGSDVCKVVMMWFSNLRGKQSQHFLLFPF